MTFKPVLKKKKLQCESKGMSQRESQEKLRADRGKQKRGRVEEKEGGKRRKREGVGLESGGRLLLWPDVSLSKQPQLSSRAFLLDSDPPFGKSAVDIYEKNVRKAQAEVQFLCQRRKGCGRGSDKGRLPLLRSPKKVGWTASAIALTARVNHLL